MSFCPKCGHKNREDVKYCASCGTPLPAGSKINQAQQPSSIKQNNKTMHEGSGSTLFIQIIIVLVICALVPLLLGSILGWPVRFIKGLMPQWNCTSEVVGSMGMYLCSMKIGLMAILPPILIMILLLFLRKTLNKGVLSLNRRLPLNAQFILPPVLATVIFTMAWAGYHAETWSTVGIVPHNIFPAFVGLYTFLVIWLSLGIQNNLAAYFSARDKIPVFLRYVLVLAIPMAIALIITNQDRVTNEALKEQVIVLIGLVVAYLLIAPKLNANYSTNNMNTTNRGLAGSMAAILLISIPASVLARIIFEIVAPDVALAHDCSSEADCQQTSGYNAATGTGGAAIGAASGVIGSQLGGGGSAVTSGITAGDKGGSTTDGSTPVDYTDFTGGPDDNLYTDFLGGDGPGQCPPGSIPIGLPNYWINTATLDLVIQDTIFISQGLGPFVNLKMTFNARSNKQGIFGSGWRMNYESNIENRRGYIELLRGSGQILRYRPVQTSVAPNPNQPAEAISINGGFNRLLDYGSYWLFIEKDTKLMYRYDKLPDTGEGKLNTIYDRNGNAVQINYNNDGTINSITDAANRSFTFAMDSMKRCIALSLPDGRKATFTYDNNGNLIETRDLQDIPSIYEYDTDRFISRMIVGYDKKTTNFTYKIQGRGKKLSTVTNAAGNITSYEQSSNNPGKVIVIDPEGKTYTYTSRDGITEQVTDPLARSVNYGYSGGRRVSVQSRNGQTSRMDYDSRGNMIKRIDAMGMTTVFTFDEYDNLLSETNPLGETWQYRYDNRGNLTSMISPTGRIFASEYDSRGQIIATIDGNGGRTSLTYDRYGNLETSTDPLGSTTRFSHDPLGLMLTGITDACGNTTMFEHDKNNRLIKVIHPDASFNIHVYDCCSEVLTRDENGNESYTLRNPLQAVSELTDKNGNVAKLTYNRNGELISYTDPASRRFTVNYDNAGYPTEWANQRGETIRINRDAMGNATSIINEKGAQTSLIRDINNRITNITDPLGKKQSFNWNPAGYLTAITNGRGDTISFSYDSDGRTIAKSHNTKMVSSYEYDKNSNLTRISGNSCDTTYQYDAANRITLIRYSNSLEIVFSYDQTGNISFVRYPGGIQVKYSYDNRNRLTNIDWGEHSVSYRYDAMNNILNETRSNGIVSEYVYNANREYIEIKHRKDNDIFVHLRYTRDAIGNIITESGTSPLEIPFTNTALNCTYNIADQVEICGTERYEYDNDGNLTVIGNGRWKAVYNAENQLTELTHNGKKIVYTYNGLNQRIGISNGQYSKRFYYDTAGRLLFETDNNGNIKAINIYAGGFLTARINESGETYFYHFDKTGSTIALTDNNGQVTAAYAYSSFGAVVNRAGQTEDNPFTYVGQFGVVDESEGLFFMKYRFYDAVTGRFIQKDPIGFDGGINQYAYVDNNPVKGIDPEGTACLPALLIFGAFMAAGWYLKCQFQGNAPWDKALNLHNVKSPTQRQEQASQISQEGKPYMRDMVMGTGDKALSINPVTGPGYSAIKAAHAAGEGDAVGVLRNAPCAPANNIGSAATVANESYDAYNAHKNAK